MFDDCKELCFLGVITRTMERVFFSPPPLECVIFITWILELTQSLSSPGRWHWQTEVGRVPELKAEPGTVLQPWALGTFSWDHYTLNQQNDSQCRHVLFLTKKCHLQVKNDVHVKKTVICIKPFEILLMDRDHICSNSKMLLLAS